MERVGFLEKKIKEQNDEHNEDNQRLMQIIGRSKEIFKHLFDNDESSARYNSECPDSTI